MINLICFILFLGCTAMFLLHGYRLSVFNKSGDEDREMLSGYATVAWILAATVWLALFAFL